MFARQSFLVPPEKAHHEKDADSQSMKGYAPRHPHSFRLLLLQPPLDNQEGVLGDDDRLPSCSA